MPSIVITGFPYPSPVVIDDVSECDTHGSPHWGLTRGPAGQLLDAWTSARGGEDVCRSFEIFEIGLIATALYLDGEINMSGWESATGSDGTDIYSTANMPFDFEIEPA